MEFLMRRLVATFLLCFVLIALVACGGGSSTPPPPPPPSLVISPASANVVIGGSQNFAVTNFTGAVTWTLTGPGTISSSGVYLAPSTFPGTNQDQVKITATAGSQTGSTTATVVFPNNHGSFQSGPIKLGTSGGNVNDVSSTSCCIGTLGSLINRGGTFLILSNNHVLDRSGTGQPGIDQINQPGPTACFGLNKTVATLTQGAALKPTAGSDPNGCSGSTAPFCGSAPSNVDAAVAAVVSNTIVDNVGGVPTGSILDLAATAGSTSIGDAPPSSTPGVATIGMQVAKSGRTSGLTCSSISSTNTTIRVSYDSSCGGAVAFDATFHNQILVNGTNFLESGDSGSLLVNAANAQPVGLLYASGSSGAAANTIQDVITAFTQTGPPAVVPTIVGGSDHPVSCAPTASITGTQVGQGGASTLTPKQRQAATAAMERHIGVLRADPAVKSISVAASADSPGDSAVLIEVSGATTAAIPATLDGVRTRVIYTGGAPALSAAAIKSAVAVKEAHESAFISQRGIQGVGVGRSDDNPAEPAITIYTVRGIAHNPIPAVIDGVRTKIIDGTPFVAR
jgi:hypothetical protein